MFATDVPFDLFSQRRDECRNIAKVRGLKGVIVASRGGGTWDRYAGGQFFANHYQQRCYLPDNLPRWSGRSHSLLLIPSEGKDCLLVTTLEYRKDLVAIDDVRFNNNFFELLASSLKEKGMDQGKVGIIYEDVITGTILRHLYESCPNIELIPSDDIIEGLRTVKTPREIQSIKKACEIGSKAVSLIMENVEAGKTEAQVLAPGIAHVFAEGAVLYFVVANGGENADAVHSIDLPGYDCTTPLKNGSIFKVDFILVYEGYICDFGRTTVVGEASKEQRDAIVLVTDACEEVIKHVKPGMKVSELCKIGDDYLESHGASLSEVQDDPNQLYAAFPPHWGHGIGLTWEKPWFVQDCDDVIGENWYLAIEKALYKPGFGVVTFEQNLLVTKDGCQVISTTPKYWV